MKDSSGLDLGGSVGDDEEWSEYGYIIKVEQKGFASGLDVGCERQREESKETLRILA